MDTHGLRYGHSEVLIDMDIWLNLDHRHPSLNRHGQINTIRPRGRQIEKNHR